MPPRFVVLDGGEGCGKTTQVKLLAGAYARHFGREPLVVRDPGTTRIGEQIRGLLLNPDHTEMAMRCEMLLYMAARAQMAVETIRPALAAGQPVVCDRFVSSTLAYQLGGDHLTATDIRTVANVALGGLRPGRTVILDMPAEASIQRVNRAKDRIEQRPPEYHQQVRANFLQQAEVDATYAVVDASESIESVHAGILRAVGLDDAPLFDVSVAGTASAS
jgi:dTMP kinase